MNYDYSDSGLLNCLLEQLAEAGCSQDRKHLFGNLLEEYLLRVLAFALRHADDLEEIHSGLFWRMVVIATNQLSREVHDGTIVLSEDAIFQCRQFVSAIRMLDEKEWVVDDCSHIEDLARMGFLKR